MLRKTKLATLLLVVCFLPFAFATSASAVLLTQTLDGLFSSFFIDATYQAALPALDANDGLEMTYTFETDNQPGFDLPSLTGFVDLSLDPAASLLANFVNAPPPAGDAGPIDPGPAWDLANALAPTNAIFTAGNPDIFFYDGLDVFGGLPWLLSIGPGGVSFTDFLSSDLTQLSLFITGTLVAVAPLEVVPEPATMLLLGTGLLGLAYMGRRRKKI